MPLEVRAEHQRSALRKYAKNICDKVVEVWYKHDKVTERLRIAEASRDELQQKYHQAKQQVMAFSNIFRNCHVFSSAPTSKGITLYSNLYYCQCMNVAPFSHVRVVGEVSFT